LVAPIVLLGDDADMDQLAVSLPSIGLPVLRWSFAARDEDVELDARPGSFQIRRGDRHLSSADLGRASAIVHRAGNLSHIVTATCGSNQEKAFAEREWSSLLTSLLLEVEVRHPGILWVNRPSTGLVTSRKYQLLATADLDGLRVPRLHVSTQNRLPESRSGEYVCKAIDEDEDVNDRFTYASARLPTELVQMSPFRTNCPSLIQERIAASYELRVYYLLGSIFGLRVAARDPDYSDIRLISRESLTVEPAAVDVQLAATLRNYCDRHRLSYCAFDFLVTADEEQELIDVTPGGSWSFFESPNNPFVSQWYASTLAAAVRDEAAYAESRRTALV
jgi:hypothetical protein